MIYSALLLALLFCFQISKDCNGHKYEYRLVCDISYLFSMIYDRESAAKRKLVVLINWES